MTRTIVESASKTAIIGFDQPFCVIGERINPTGRKKLAAELEAGDFSTVERTHWHRLLLARTSSISTLALSTTPTRTRTRPSRRSWSK